jgi:hypothetical protein
MGFKCFIQNVFKKMFFQRKHEKNNEYSDVLTVFKGDLIVTEILNGSDVVDELFLQVFGHPAPRHDKDLVRHQVSKELRSTIRQQGGFAKIAIMYVLDHNIDKVKVYFGHTAIPVILRIIDGLGFKSTDQDYLYAKWAPGVTAAQQRKLLAEAAKVGAF